MLTKMSAFVSLLQKVLTVELKLFKMDCLKYIPIIEKKHCIYYEHRRKSEKIHPLNYIALFEVVLKLEFTGALKPGLTKR